MNSLQAWRERGMNATFRLGHATFTKRSERRNDPQIASPRDGSPHTDTGSTLDAAAIAVDTARTRGDSIFRRLAQAAGFSTFAIMALIGTFLILTLGMPALREAGLAFFTESRGPSGRRRGVRDRGAARTEPSSSR